MIQLSEKEILRWQKHFRDKWGANYTIEETAEATRNLLGFFQVLLEADRKQNPQNYIKKNVAYQKKE